MNFLQCDHSDESSSAAVLCSTDTAVCLSVNHKSSNKFLYSVTIPQMKAVFSKQY